jgi:hypothetical protein
MLMDGNRFDVNVYSALLRFLHHATLVTRYGRFGHELNVNIPSGFEKNLRADLLADWWRFMPRTGHSLARPAALRDLDSRRTREVPGGKSEISALRLDKF